MYRFLTSDLKPSVLGLLILSITACKTSNHTKDNPTIPPNPPVRNQHDINLNDFTFKSFKSVPIEDRCSGITIFIKEYLGKDMPQVSLEKITCFFSSLRVGPANVVTMFLKQGTESLSIIVYLQKLDSITAVIQILDKNGKYFPFTPENPKTQIEADLINFPGVIKQWLSSEEGEVKLFGKPYMEALQDFITTYASDASAQPSMASPILRFSLTPDSSSLTKGGIKFSEMSPIYFENNRTFLGCRTIECMNDGKTTYSVFENAFEMSRPSPLIPTKNFTVSFTILKDGLKLYINPPDEN